MRPKEADKAVDLVNPSKLFVLDEPDLTVFLALTTWVQDEIKKNLNFTGSDLDQKLQEHSGSEGSNDETPKESNEDSDDNKGNDEGW